MRLQDEEYRDRKESSSRATIELTSVVLSAPVGDTVWQTQDSKCKGSWKALW